MATIASLIVDVSANTVKLTKDVGEIQGLLDKVGTIAGKLGGVLAGAFSVGAITGAVNKFLDMTGALTDLSAKTGISTTELQKLKYAAEQNGGSLDKVTGAIGKMGKALVEGNSGTVGAMKALGLSFTEVRNMDPATAFATIGDAIAKVPNPLERSKLAMDLFGKSGAELLPMLTGNLSETMKAAEQLGIVLDEQTVAAGDNLGDTLGALQMVGQAVIGKVLAPMLPAFQMVASAMLGAGSVVDVLRDAFDALLRMALLAVKGLMDAAIRVGEFAIQIPGASKVMGAFSGEMKMARDASEWLGGAIKGLEQGTQTATVTTKAMVPPLAALSDGHVKTAKATDAHSKATAAHIVVSAELARAMELQQKAHKEAAAAAEWRADVEAASFRKSQQAAENYLAHLPRAIFQTKSYAGAVEQVSIAAATYQGNLAGVTQATETTIDPVNKATDAIGKLSASLANMAQIAGDSMGSVVRGIGTMVSAFDAARQSQKAFSDGQKEYKDEDGSKVNGLMGMASGILGMASAAMAAGKAIKGMWDHFFGAAGRSVVEGFAETMGGFDAMHVKLLTLGDQGEQLWIKLTQGVGRNNPEQAKKVIEEINAALAWQDAWMSRLPGLIEKYGLSWEDAGIQAKQAHLDEIARGLIQDFADLSKAGFDVETITGGMTDAVNDYISQAIRTGTEIPAAMQPLLQKMIEMGVLTDENGLKLDTLEGLTFATTLTAGFASVVTAIQELTRALTGDLGGALDGLSRRKVVIPIGFETEAIPRGESPTASLLAGSMSRVSGGGGAMMAGRGGGGDLVEQLAAQNAALLALLPKAITAAMQKATA